MTRFIGRIFTEEERFHVRHLNMLGYINTYLKNSLQKKKLASRKTKLAARRVIYITCRISRTIAKLWNSVTRHNVFYSIHATVRHVSFRYFIE